MSDDLVLNAGSGGATLAADEIAGIHHQRVKIQHGADGSATDVSTASPLPVSDAGGSLTVDGTVSVTGVATAANQSTANTALAAIQTAVEALDNTVAGNELQVDIVSSALPSGASTAAKQPALGTAGTASADVITVQGIASMTALKVDGSAVTQPVSAASLPLPTGAATLAEQQSQTTHLSNAATSLGTLDNAISGNEMQVDVVAALPAGDNNIGNVDVVTLPALPAGTNNIGDVDVLTLPALAAGTNNIGDVDVLTVPADPFGANADAASATGSISAKLRFIASTGIPVTGTVTVGSHAVTNAGTFVTQENGAALTALQLLDDAIKTDDAAFTPGTTAVSMAGFQADETATDSVDEGDAGAARMTLDRKQIVNPQPHTQGGLSIFRSLDLDETEEEIKSTGGNVYGWYIANLRSTPLYLKWYNATAANVTVGSTTPVMTFVLPANSTSFVAGNALGTHGITFSTAITVAATTGIADADTGAPGANECCVNIFYL